MTYLDEPVYFRIYKEDAKENEVTDKNGATIKCKVIDSRIEENNEGQLNFYCNLEPLGDLPDWFDEEFVQDYFNDIPIDRLYTNPTWCH